MSDFEEKDDRTDEEKKEDFLNVLKLLGAMASQQNKEEQMKDAAMTIGKVLYITYSGMLAAGFDKDQALELTKCLIFGRTADDILKK